MSHMPEHCGSMQDYGSYLGSIERRVRDAFPGVHVFVANLPFGGGGAGEPVVTVQGEFVERVRGLLNGSGNINVVPLSQEMYDILNAKGRQ